MLLSKITFRQSQNRQ